jgi:hypothetical protein
MKTVRRTLIPILCLVCTSVGAASNGHADGGAGAVTPLSSSMSAPASDAEAIMRRVRAVIEELKRQGPPPVGCMEG